MKTSRIRLNGARVSLCIAVLACGSAPGAHAAQGASIVPSPWVARDVGKPGISRATSFDQGTFAITASDTDIGGTAASAPTRVVFHASADHFTAVTSYQLDIFASGADLDTATPVASSDLAKPTPDSAGDIALDRSSFFAALVPGLYIATVSAIGPGGHSRSVPLTFERNDPTGLAISNVQVFNLTNTAATITWTTNVAADSRVDYGPTTGYGQNVTDATLVSTHALTLSGLTAGTTYHYQVTSSTGSAQVTSSDLTVTTPPLPVISTVQVSNLTSTAATITWTTNVAADSRVDYGPTMGYGQNVTDATLVSTHVLTLTGLTAGTTYHYQVTSRNANGQDASSDLSLATVAPWPYYKTITIDHTKVAGPLSNFPVLVSLPSDPNLKSSAQPTGNDLLFTLPDGTKLSHELETYDGTTGQLVAWVKVPSLSATVDTVLYLKYGNAAAANQEDPPNVWTGYAATWHLKESPTGPAPQFKDATGNAHDGTSTGGQVAGDQVAGQVGYGLHFDGINDFVQTTSEELKTADSFTVSLWFKATQTNFAHHLLWQGNASENGWGSNGQTAHSEMHISLRDFTGSARDNTLSFFLGQQSDAVDSGGLFIETPFTDTTGWNHVVVRVSTLGTAPSAQMFLNGALVGSDTGVATSVARGDWDTSLRLGRPGASTRYFNGLLDEVEILPTAVSNAWITTAYTNQAAPQTFSTVTNGPTELAIANVQATVLRPTSATITWTTTVAADSRVDYGPTTGAGQSVAASPLVTAHSLTLLGLTDGATYHYHVASSTGSAQATSGDLTFTTPTAPPPLIISNVQVATLTTTGATITWTTYMAADSRVDYGPTTGHGQNVTDANLVSSHSIAVSGLTAGTTYHFTVASRDISGNQAGSMDRTLTTPGGNVVHHYEYVIPDSFIYVYDTDDNFNLVKVISVPTSDGVRGAVAHAATGKLYISYGSGGFGAGYLLKYDLRTDTIVWTHSYPSGIDSMDITPDGSTIYMPTGSGSSGGDWIVINTTDGSVITTITATKGTGPHNTIVGPDGRYVYLGAENSEYLEVADTTTNQIVKTIGPLNFGVSPFTINGKQTLAYTTSTLFIGFQVSDIQTGQVLYTVPISGSGAVCCGIAPSHGISVSPDEQELYVVDYPNNMVHVFDIGHVPLTAPVLVASLHLVGSLHGVENGCAQSCDKDGWLRHSRDGRFVFVGDAGDVIDTATRQTVTVIPTLANTRKSVEVDWQDENPVFGSSRAGIGYVR